MAVFTGTYTRHTAIGVREELANQIFDISPEDTPVLSGCSRESISNTLFEWQLDTLASAAANAQIEGDDVTSYTSVTPTVRIGNYAQISRKLLLVSGTLEAVDKAGRKSEIAYQMARRGAEIKRDMEYTILSNVAGDAGAVTAGRTTATLGAFVKTNTDAAITNGDPTYTSGVPSAARTDAATTLQRAFSETILKNVAQKIWTQGGKMSQLFVGPVNKAKVSAFTGVVTRNYDIAQPKPTAVIASADVYVTDWGTLRVQPNRFQRERDAWFLDFEYLGIGILRNFATYDMAKTGDAIKKMLLIEWGLKVKAEKALGLAADLTTT